MKLGWGTDLERLFFFLFFFYLVVEGALRKWAFPQAGTLLFLIKDLLLFAAFLSYLGKVIFNRSKIVPVLRPSETLVVWCWIFFFFMQFLLSNMNITAIAGLRYYLVMLPIVVLLPRNFECLNSFEKSAKVYLLCSLPVILLGIIQYMSAPGSLLNVYAWESSSYISVFGSNKARITGTFSYISGMAAYLQALFVVALGFLSAGNNRKNVIIWLILLLLSVNIGMTGSRAPIVISFLCSLPFLVPAVLKVIKRRNAIVVVPVIAAVLSVAAVYSSPVFLELWERNVSAGDAETRYMGAILWPINTLMRSDLTGHGIGATFMGVRELSGADLEVGFDEVSSDRIGVETGIFGYLLVLFFKIFFLVANIGLLRRSVNSQIKTWALVALLLQLSQLWTIPIYNSVASAFYFGAIGLYILARNEQVRLTNEMRVVTIGR